jgi:hypothetical protein
MYRLYRIYNLPNHLKKMGNPNKETLDYWKQQEPKHLEDRIVQGIILVVMWIAITMIAAIPLVFIYGVYKLIF